MCCRTITENGEMLGFFPDSYKNQKMYYKGNDKYFLLLRFIPYYYEITKMFNIAFGTYPSANKKIHPGQ